MITDNDPAFENVRRAVEQITEQWDTCQIFVTKHEPTQEGGTISFGHGSGNFQARYGQIIEWITIQEERGRIQARKEQEP